MSERTIEQIIAPKMEPTLSPEEAAQYLKVHVQTIYELCRSGEIPSAKIGSKTVRIKPEDLDAFFESRRTVKTGAAFK
jgi:excisionase family DNA binding protein